MVDLDELERLAATGDPDAPIPADAIPWAQYLAGDDEPEPDALADLLPDWYMPRPMAGTPPLRGWRRMVAWLIVIAFLAVVSSGLCSTYGVLEIA